MRASELRPVVSWELGGRACERTDELAREEPLEVRVDGQPVSVTMRTPGEDAELALGFLLSEGLLRDREQVRDVVVDPACNVVDVSLRPGVEVDLARLTRHVFASSSCGLCGKATIEAVHGNFPPLEPGFSVAAHAILRLAESLGRSQPLFARTGGLHAAAVGDDRGELLAVREDVGRHNAVDKILGWAFRAGRWPLDRHVLFVSGRASFEILQKALSARIPVVAAVSAPSSLATSFALASRQALVGFVRPPRMNVYSCPERIRFEPAGESSRSQ
ncbi:MAG: sulfurtransferase FdhD [Candidatus Binatia bacterium]|nr:MAG: sulfurtransferase FdhD [Candidatus Binatia bacterium]